MKWCESRLVLFVAFVLWPSCLHAQPAEETDENEPPIAGQPMLFNGAVGDYQIATRADRTELQAEDPILFTIRITGTGPAEHLPRRPNLRQIPEFSRRFQIDDLPREDRTLPAERLWEFNYRLRPKSLTPPVDEIPAVPFVYYKPPRYHTRFSDPIPLKVKPREAVTPAEVPGEAIRFPDYLYELADGPAVLRHEHASPLAAPLALALLLLTPPALCTGWYVCRRHWLPEGTYLKRRHRSRAARAALKALRALGCKDSHPHVVASVLTDYLRQRFGLQVAEPSPTEVAVYLQEIGCPDILSAKAADVFRACDAARFAPDSGSGRRDLATAGAGIILALETLHAKKG